MIPSFDVLTPGAGWLLGALIKITVVLVVATALALGLRPGSAGVSPAPARGGESSGARPRAAPSHERPAADAVHERPFPPGHRAAGERRGVGRPAPPGRAVSRVGAPAPG